MSPANPWSKFGSRSSEFGISACPLVEISDFEFRIYRPPRDEFSILNFQFSIPTHPPFSPGVGMEIQNSEFKTQNSHGWGG